MKCPIIKVVAQNNHMFFSREIRGSGHHKRHASHHQLPRS
jgi:hypothetical protein